jgi:hypothetical protein
MTDRGPDGRDDLLRRRQGGSPLLWDELFWFFGHPEVYILALPGFGIVLEILPVFARKPLWGYRLAVAGMFGVALMSFMVWQHHLFMSGINANLRPFYMFTTELISIPTGLIFLNGMGTLWRARIRFTVPMLFALAFFFNFLIGGLSGVFLSDVHERRVDARQLLRDGPLPLHDHGRAGVRADGRDLLLAAEDDRLQAERGAGKLHFWTMFIFFNLTFFPLFAAGMLGMPRRVSSYNASLHTLNVFVSIMAFCLGLSMLIFLYNLVWSLVFKREPRGREPVGVEGLEWQLPSPVPVYNFERIPTITSIPMATVTPDAPAVADFGPRVIAGEGGWSVSSHEGQWSLDAEDPASPRERTSRSARGCSRAPSCSSSWRSCSRSSTCARSTRTSTSRAAHQPAVGWGVAILACVLVSTCHLRAGAPRSSPTAPETVANRMSLLAFVLALAAVVLQAARVLQPSSSARPTVGWRACSSASRRVRPFWLGAVYWIETLWAQSLRQPCGRSEATSLTHLAPAASERRRLRSSTSTRWVVVELFAFVLLYVVK